MRYICFVASVTILACSSTANHQISDDAFDAHTSSDIKEISDISKKETFVKGPNPKNIPIFDESKVVEFRLEFEESAWNQLMTYWKSGVVCYDTCIEDAKPCEIKTWVHCSFSFEGETFKDAACHLKGNPAYWKDEKKPELAIRFNKWDKNGRFRGLRRINLEAAPFVYAPIRDRVAMWYMREVGLDAPRVNHVNVYKNGELLGLYMNIEQLDKEFLEDHFEECDGNLYKNGCELVTNEDKMDLQNIWDLEWYIDKEPMEGDHTKFFENVDKLMDVDQVLLEAAAEMVIPTGDNFSNGSWNFYYYDHPSRGFLVLPWDLDGAFGGYIPVTLDPFAFESPPEVGNKPNKLLLLMMQNPSWKAKYISNLKMIRDGPYQKLPDRIDFVCNQIRPHYINDPNKNGTVEKFDQECEYYKKRIGERTNFLKNLLGG